MAIPGENYLAVTWPSVLPSRGMSVEAMLTIGFDTVALVTWGRENVVGLEATGSALIRFDPLGNVRWQKNLQIAWGDEGAWGWQPAGLAPTPDGGVIVLGSVPLVPGPSWFSVVGARYSDKGDLLWVRRYPVTTSGGEFHGEGRGIVRLGDDDRYLVAAAALDADQFGTWFFQIDGSGFPLPGAYEIPDLDVQRLRSTPSQGIFALGTHFTAPATWRGYIMNLDPVAALPRWERSYDAKFPPPPSAIDTIQWWDIAEGSDSLIVVGNAMERGLPAIGYVASLGMYKGDASKAGVVKWARSPIIDERVNGYFASIANMQFDPIPIAGEPEGPRPQIEPGAGRWSAFALTGAVGLGDPWLVEMAEDGSVMWQKSYRGAIYRGALLHVVWPSYDQIVGGGWFDTTGGGPSHGIVVSSAADPGRGRLMCGAETKGVFHSTEISSAWSESGRRDIHVLTDDRPHVEVNPVTIEHGCPRKDEATKGNVEGAASREFRPRFAVVGATA